MRRLTLLAMVVLVAAACGPEPSAVRPSGSTRQGTLATPTTGATRSAAPSKTPPATATPAPTATGEVHWAQLAEVPSVSAANGGGPFGVVGFDDGYVITDEESGAVQYSADGVTWKPVRLRHPKGSPLGVFDVATDGSRVVAVGQYTPCSSDAWWHDPYGRCRARPASWATEDGRSWQSSAAWTGSVGPKGQAGSALYHVWAVPGAGFEAAQGWNTSDDSDGLPIVGPALWHSDDGRTWSLLRPKPPAPSTDCDPYYAADSFQAIADASGRRFAIEYPGEYCDDLSEDGDESGESEEDVAPIASTPGPFFSASTDGKQYERFVEAPPTDGVETIVAPIAGRPWVSLGTKALSEPDAEVSVARAIAATSTDLKTWTTTDLPVPADAATAGVWDLAHADIGYLGTGYVHPTYRYVTWLSDDGASWRIASVDAVDAVALEQVVDGPAGLLALGTLPVSADPEEEEYQLTVWGLREMD